MAWRQRLPHHPGRLGAALLLTVIGAACRDPLIGCTTAVMVGWLLFSENNQ